MTNKALRFLNTKTGMLTVLVACVVGGAYYVRKKAPVAMGNAALNATNPILNGAVNWVGQKVTGNEDWTIVGAVYDEVD